ncbi:hypothetical protein IFM89_035563 [Coptis chinensis]|uniref:Uncharacterized protein n=1 Tax=Coptis chinensis TaxID=261450 RepID=A0A835HWH8_9MAGN|nr:hypothetical protein IFM89_035563 [Coptis chinensis]
MRRLIIADDDDDDWDYGSVDTGFQPKNILFKSETSSGSRDHTNGVSDISGGLDKDVKDGNDVEEMGDGNVVEEKGDGLDENESDGNDEEEADDRLDEDDDSDAEEIDDDCDNEESGGDQKEDEENEVIGGDEEEDEESGFIDNQEELTPDPVTDGNGNGLEEKGDSSDENVSDGNDEKQMGDDLDDDDVSDGLAPIAPVSDGTEATIENTPSVILKNGPVTKDIASAGVDDIDSRASITMDSVPFNDTKHNVMEKHMPRKKRSLRVFLATDGNEDEFVPVRRKCEDLDNASVLDEMMSASVRNNGCNESSEEDVSHGNGAEETVDGSDKDVRCENDVHDFRKKSNGSEQNDVNDGNNTEEMGEEIDTDCDNEEIGGNQAGEDIDFIGKKEDLSPASVSDGLGLIASASAGLAQIAPVSNGLQPIAAFCDGLAQSAPVSDGIVATIEKTTSAAMENEHVTEEVASAVVNDISGPASSILDTVPVNDEVTLMASEVMPLATEAVLITSDSSDANGLVEITMQKAIPVALESVVVTTKTVSTVVISPSFEVTNDTASVVAPKESSTATESHTSVVSNDDLVSVDCVMVPARFANLYHQIFLKHGHLETTEIVNVRSVSHALLVELLRVISALKKVRLSDLTVDVLNDWESGIGLGEAVRFNVGWLREVLNQLKARSKIYETCRGLMASVEERYAERSTEIVTLTARLEKLKGEMDEVGNALEVAKKARNDLTAKINEARGSLSESDQLFCLVI